MELTPCLEGSEVGEKEAVGCRVQRLLFLPPNLICVRSDTD